LHEDQEKIKLHLLILKQTPAVALSSPDATHSDKHFVSMFVRKGPDGNVCYRFTFIFAHVFMISLEASTRKPKVHPAILFHRLTTSNPYQATLFIAFAILWTLGSMCRLLYTEI